MADYKDPPDMKIVGISTLASDDTPATTQSQYQDCLYNDILTIVKKWTERGEPTASVLTQLEMALGVFIAFYSLPGQQHVVIQAVANNLPVRVREALAREIVAQSKDMDALATIKEAGHA